MTEEQEAKAGAELAYDLDLKQDTEHKDRWQTRWGSKTNLGLWRTVARMVDDARIKAEISTESTKQNESTRDQERPS